MVTAATAMIHVRVDEEIKAQAADTLASMGLSVSDAVRVFLKRVVVEKAMPFDVRVPNAEVIVRDRNARLATAQDLFDDLESGSKQ
jgi:DNA-damage-inducible protein J